MRTSLREPGGSEARGRGGGTNLLRLGAGSQWIVAAKATLPRTMPRREFKSSAKDSAHRPFGTAIQGVRAGRLRDRHGASHVTCPWGPRPLLPVGGRTMGSGAAFLARILT